jgi:hypothetical protein
MGDDMAESKQKPRMSFINIIPSPVVTQALASAGADAVVIDQEHAPVGPESLHAMIASTAGTKCLPFVRVADEQSRESRARIEGPDKKIARDDVHARPEHQQLPSSAGTSAGPNY